MLFRSNFERMNLKAEVVAVPAEDWEDERTFDAVLLDAPCTATGTYRRNPEVLRATRPADVAKLPTCSIACWTRPPRR